MQNPGLIFMLSATKPKLLVEASMDKLWGTGVALPDSNALDTSKWSSNGWLSDMLMDIQKEAEEEHTMLHNNNTVYKIENLLSDITRIRFKALL